mgnify:CR=1 FL=1
MLKHNELMLNFSELPAFVYFQTPFMGDYSEGCSNNRLREGASGFYPYANNKNLLF